jgi:hypothetical protein
VVLTKASTPVSKTMSSRPEMVHFLLYILESIGHMSLIIALGYFCMRVCEDGRGEPDKCNAKKDTVGCPGTMGYTDRPGWTYLDTANGITTTLSVSVPPPKTTANPTPTNALVSVSGTVTVTAPASFTGTASVSAKSNGSKPVPDSGLNMKLVSLLIAIVGIAPFLAL